MTTAQKVTTDHLRRLAYLYVRQSSLQQVHDHRESTVRQYDLKSRAQALGWPTDRIQVIDEDQGLSGASSTERDGFQRLVADVGLGRVGLVMGLEVSRLARNSSDWHRLLEICALTETLILDEDGVYDPAHFNDRLLLGLNRPDSYSTTYSTSRRSVNGLEIRPWATRVPELATVDTHHVRRRDGRPKTIRRPAPNRDLGQWIFSGASLGINRMWAAPRTRPSRRQMYPTCCDVNERP